MLLGLLAMALLIPFPEVKASALTAQSSAPALKHGEKIFQTRCSVCHDKKPGDTSPFGPPNLFNVFGGKPPKLTTAQAEQIIEHGKAQMPAFRGLLSKVDVRDVIDYLRQKGQGKP